MTKNMCPLFRAKSRPMAVLVAGLLWAGLAQAQESANASGGDDIGGGGTASYSIGQVFYETYTDTNVSLSEGVQQPLEKTSYVYNDAWLPRDPNGVASINDDILIASGDASISSNTSANSVTVNPGAGLTVNSDVTLTTPKLTLESTSQTYSSLIQNGNITGTVNYERFVNVIGTSTGGGNDLITPPLNGQRFVDFATANEGVLAASGTVRAFAPFVNDANPGEYSNFDTAANAETTLEAGIGYRAAAGAVLRFTGTANTTDMTIGISAAVGTYGKWNLIGNPYPSYLDINAFLTYQGSSGTQNIDLLDNPSGIYGYNGNASDRWKIITLANSSGQLMAPGQGFFVASGSAGGNLQFTTAMRRSAGGDDFISGRNAALVYLKLQAATSTKRHTTEFYFNEQSSLGLDLGYDAKTWGGQSSGFMLYSHLVEDNTGLPIGLQSLHSADLAHTSIPLGVNSNAGEQLTFSIAESTLPASVNVYLEDVVTNISTLLNNADYVISPTTALSGTGRFFLRTSADALATIDNDLKALNIFSLNTSKELVVTGQLKGQTSLKLYDLQGRQVWSTNLDDRLIQNRMDVSSLSTGVYVVKLQNNEQQRSQKVIIK